jgi:hypothetical protein
LRPRRRAFGADRRRSLGAQERVIATTDSTPLRSTSWNNVLGRIVSVHLSGVTIETALRAVAERAALRLSYSSDIIPAERRVSVERERTAAGDVIREILRDTGLDVVVSPAGYVVVVRTPILAHRARSAYASADSIGAAPRLTLARSTARPQMMDRIL